MLFEFGVNICVWKIRSSFLKTRKSNDKDKTNLNLPCSSESFTWYIFPRCVQCLCQTHVLRNLLEREVKLSSCTDHKEVIDIDDGTTPSLSYSLTPLDTLTSALKNFFESVQGELDSSASAATPIKSRKQRNLARSKVINPRSLFSQVCNRFVLKSKRYLHDTPMKMIMYLPSELEDQDTIWILFSIFSL